MEEAGRKLKRAREKLELTFRQVADASARIAAIRKNEEYTINPSRLVEIEKGEALPTIFRFYSLCAIYRLELLDVLEWYGVSPATLPADSSVISVTKTHAIGFRPEVGEIQVPDRVDPGFDPAKTVFLSRLIEKWGWIPVMLFNHLDLRNLRYGYIGTEDWSMHPIIPPGSLVVVDETKRRIPPSTRSSEFDRPIFFLEHDGGYVCGYCTARDGRLTVQFRVSSGQEPESYEYPGEIEVIGQVTCVAMMLGQDPPQSS
jgi:transcriptional regulator with XRE-family HTH domain